MRSESKLVSFTCKCGCGMKWKALPGSTMLYAAQTHAPVTAVSGFGRQSPGKRGGRPRKDAKAEYEPENVEEEVAADDEPPEQIDLREILPA